MRIYPKVTLRLTDFGIYVVPEPFYDYSGPLWGAKKGDKEKAVGAKQEKYGDKEQGIQDSYRSASDPFMRSLLPGAGGVGTFPGSNTSIAGGTTGTSGGAAATAGMSPYAASQYGADVENISNTYNNLRQNAFRTLGARGFGNAPAGFGASMTNNINNQQAQATTGAYRAGLDRTLNEGLTAANYFQRGQEIYNPNPSYAGATSSYNAGDTQAGNSWRTAIGGATGLASMFIPGGGFASLLKGAGSAAMPMTDLNLGTSSTADALIKSAGGFSGLPPKYASTAPGRY